MEHRALLRAATHLVTSTHMGSPSMLMRRLNQDHGHRITFSTAVAVLDQLHTLGIVEPADGSKARSVLMDAEQATATLDRHYGAEGTEPEYECPQCCRVAPWTDGRIVSAGDPLDEFWCQTCGAETPLITCEIKPKQTA